MRAAVPTREEYLARWAALHGGYDARGNPLVRGWLRVVYPVARPLASARVPADLVTSGALLVSGCATLAAWAGGGWLWCAAVLVALSGLLDGVDGAVAVLGAADSRFGAVLDSTVDRCSDALHLLALWLAGASAAVCVGAGFASMLLEYVRARAAGAGMAEVGVVTVGERPTRVAVATAFLAAQAALPDRSWVALGAWVWLAVCLVGLSQLLVVVRRRLSRDG